jgi:hypothetical protein
MMGWTPSSQGVDELVWRYIGLAQNTGKSADLDFAVHRNDTAFGATPHDDMATGLANFRKPQSFKRPNCCGTGDMR